MAAWDLGQYAPDPIGAFLQGFSGMRRLRLQEEEATRSREALDMRKKLFEYNLRGQERKEKEELALPGARQRVLGAAGPEPFALDEESQQRAGLPGMPSMADIERGRRPVRTLQELQGRVRSPEDLELVSRLSPGTLNLMQLQSPEQAQTYERGERQRTQAETLYQEALKDMQDPDLLLVGLTKFNQAQTLMGRQPAIHDLTTAARDQAWKQEGPKLAALAEKAIGGDEAAARSLFAESFKITSPTGRSMMPSILQTVTAVLGPQIPDDVEQAYGRFGELLGTVDNDPRKAMALLIKEKPEAVLKMRKMGLLPDEYKEAVKAAETIRTAGAVEGARLDVREQRAATLRARALEILRTGEAAGRPEEQINQDILKETGLDAEVVRRGMKKPQGATLKTFLALSIQVAKSVFGEDPIKQQAFVDWAANKQTFIGRYKGSKGAADLYAETVKQIKELGGDPARYPGLRGTIGAVSEGQAIPGAPQKGQRLGVGTLPPPAIRDTKITVRDERTGERKKYKSDGIRWVEVPLK